MWLKKLPLSGVGRGVEHSTPNESDHQQTLQTGVVSIVRDHRIAQVAFGFRRFFAHQVAHPCAVALYFTCTSHLESLLGAGVGFHFRHDKNDEF